MGLRGGSVTAACVFFALAGPAWADRVLVLERDGDVHAERYELAPAERARATRPRAAAAAKRTIRGELRRLLEAGAITQAEHDERRSLVRDAEDLLDRLSGARAAQLAGALDSIETIAARGALTVGRLEPLWRILDTNIHWANHGPLLGSGQRVSVEGSELVYQYVPGSGLQLHPLANAGKLNDLWRKPRTTARDGRIAQLLDELLPLAAERAGGAAWEYYFPFYASAPWVSGMAQGTMLQATARASIRLGIREETWPLLKSGLNIFEADAPAGVRVSTGSGAHYALYSQRPGLRVLNGFAQALIGLYDFGAYANDDRARALFAAGEAELTQELPAFDTGAWSLYSRVDVTREADLSYHRLVTDFLAGLCERTGNPTYCDYQQRFAGYLTTPPALEVISRRLRAGATGRLKFGLSKISRVGVVVKRGRRTYLSTSATVGYGRRYFSWKPTRRGTYTVTLSATDLAGNSAAAEGEITVLPKKKKKRRSR